MEKTSCTILISITHELVFLKRSIEQIRKFKHPYIKQDIIISDQSDEKMSAQIQNLYGNDEDITILKIEKIDSGWSIDRACKIAKGEYFCTLDGDAFPIHPNWLYVPIKMIEKYGISYIGKDTDLSESYLDYGNFSCINNYYRVGRTDLTRKISEDVGFIRLQNHEKVGFKGKMEVPIKRDVDSAVIAQWYAEKIAGPKFSIKINKILGHTKKQGVFGMFLDSLVFHMVFWRKMEDDEFIDVNKDETWGEDYLRWRELINKRGITDEVLELILNSGIELPENERSFNNQYINENDEIYKYFDTLKNERF